MNSDIKNYLIIALIFTFSIFAFILFLNNDLGNSSVSKLVLDDAYITYRFAYNLHNGDGFVWNTNDVPFFGNTSFIFPYIASISYFISNNIAQNMQIFNIFLLLACIYLVYLLSKLMNLGNFFYLSLVLILVTPAVLFNVFLGMETILFMFCLIFSFYLFVKRYYFALSFISPLIYLVRPEGLVLTGIYFALIYLRDFLPSTIRELKYSFLEFFKCCGDKMLISLVTFGLIVLFLFSIFGDFLPMSFYVKALGGSWYKPVLYIGQFIFFFSIYISFSIYGLINIKKFKSKSKIYVLTFLFIILYLSAYLIIYPSSAIFHRFLIPIVPLLYLMFIFVVKRIIVFKGLRIIPSILFIVVILLFPVAQMNFDYSQFKGLAQTKEIRENNIIKYIDDHYDCNTKILISDIGYVPYKLNCYTFYDSYGLTSIDKSRIWDTNHILKNIKPDLIILKSADKDVFNGEIGEILPKIETPIYRNDYFNNNYLKVKVLEDELYLFVYELIK